MPKKKNYGQRVQAVLCNSPFNTFPGHLPTRELKFFLKAKVHKVP